MDPHVKAQVAPRRPRVTHGHDAGRRAWIPLPHPPSGASESCEHVGTTRDGELLEAVDVLAGHDHQPLEFRCAEDDDTLVDVLSVM